MHFGPWDIALALGVSVQATMIAFFHNPWAKTLIYTIPIPFSLANLALGTPIQSSYIAGFLLLLIYVVLVWWLHAVRRVPIVAAIAAASVLYCAIGTGVHAILPTTEPAVWIAFGVLLVTALTLMRSLPYRVEQGHRSELPVVLKFPIVFAVITVLILMKNLLGGFMATFPMVGVVAAYETRHSLWAMVRQTSVLLLGIGSMAALMYVLQHYGGFTVAASLGPGVTVWAAVVLPVSLARRRAEMRNRLSAAEEEGGASTS